VKLYHRTFHAAAILAAGFRDGEDTYLTGHTFRGVWFSDQPLGVNEGVAGNTVLTIEVREPIFEEYEWVEEGKGYRESLIPADLANRYGPPRRESVQDEER
jgi:hypothetical protein